MELLTGVTIALTRLLSLLENKEKVTLNEKIIVFSNQRELLKDRENSIEGELHNN